MRKVSRRQSPAQWAERLEDRVLFTVFGGVDFPQGISSFADTVISYQPAKPQQIAAGAKHPINALGPPDSTNVSLGQGGKLTLGFTDNVLTNSATAKNDLWIFEVGPDVESTFVYVHPTPDTKPLLSPALDPDGDGYYAVGEIKGSTRGVDIDKAIPGFAPGKLRFDAILMIDDPNQGDGSPGTPGADINAVGAITSSSVVPLVSVTATDANAAEAGRDPGVFTFTRSGPTTDPLKIDFSIGGTASNTTDYTSIPTSLLIPKGQSSATITIKPVDDALVEPTETVQLTITSALRYAIDPAKASAVVNIVDNDKPHVGIGAPDASASEPIAGVGSTGLFRVARDSGVGALTLTFSVGGTATIGADYTLSVSGATFSYNASAKTLQITLSAGVQQASILVTPKADAVSEPKETVVLTLIPSESFLITKGAGAATVTIADAS